MKKWWKHLLHFSQFFPGIFNFTAGIRGRGLEHAILDGPGFWSSLSNSGPSPDGQTCKMVCFEFPNVFRRYRAGSDDFLKMTRFEFPARSSQNDCFFRKQTFFKLESLCGGLTEGLIRWLGGFVWNSAEISQNLHIKMIGVNFKRNSSVWRCVFIPQSWTQTINDYREDAPHFT